MNYANPRSSSYGLTICVLPVFFIIAIFGGCSSESKGPKYEIFPPAGGKGAIVVVASGYTGPGLYCDFCSKLAALGYYTVLMDGKDLFDPGSLGLIVPGISTHSACEPRRYTSKIMKKLLLIIVFILYSNLVIAEGIVLPSVVYNNMGYRVVNSKVFDPTPWEKRKFNILEKSITKIKSIEQVPGEPNWYYRFEVIVEKFPDQRAAARYAKRALKKPPGLSPSENKSFPLRKAFQKGIFVYTVSTDVYLYYNTELDHVLKGLRRSVEQIR